jgi:alpha-tubulin suppressor-like RCC1 family protein
MRRVFAMFFSSLLLGGLLVALPAAGADAAAAVKLTVSPVHPIKKETFVVSGTIPGSPVERPVELQTLSGKKWKKVALPDTTTDAAGGFTFTTSTPSAKVSLRVYAAPYNAPDVSYPAFTSATSKVTTAAQSIKLTLPALTTYKQATAKLTASPARSGRTILLQWKEGKTWRDVTSTAQGTSTKPSIAFTPPASGKVSFRAQLSAWNGAPAVNSKEVRVTVKAGIKPLEITTTSLPEAVRGTSYSTTLAATGGTAPRVWSASALPPGLELAAGTGVISGTPTGPGTSSVSVTVTDKAKRTDQATFDLTVTTPPLVIQTRTLPEAMQNLPYSTALAATGGTAPFSWSATGLPDGLQLDPGTGEITGTPTGEGTSPVSVTVTDDAGESESATLDLTVVAPLAATRVATGGFHSCAVTDTGAVQCWGDNGFGQLGDGSEVTGRLDPVPVSGLGSGVLALGAGFNHTCAVLADHTVKCWGENSTGQLGDGTTAERGTPVTVQGLSGAVAVAGGDSFTCALTDAGAVWCWGKNSSGQLGVDPAARSTSTTPVQLLDEHGEAITNATGISAGSAHACVIRDETVSCWGSNSNQQLGFSGSNRFNPILIPGLVGVSQVSAGGDHTCVVDSHAAKCWGSTRAGALGGEPTQAGGVVEITGLGRVLSVASGDSHSCALGYTLQCWGNNNSGQLGDGSGHDHTAPADVLGLEPASARVVRMSAGLLHTCVVLDQGSLRCWGASMYGQVGNGSSAESALPAQVVGFK